MDFYASENSEEWIFFYKLIFKKITFKYFNEIDYYTLNL
jgi:hypothetical protein